MRLFATFLPVPLASLALATLMAVLPASARADTGYYMVTTYDVEGQTSVDFKYWNARYRHTRVYAPDLGIGYGVTSRWYTELYGTWVKVGERAMKFEETAWQNDFMLTQGQFDVDVALHTKIERPQDRDEGYALEWGACSQD